MAYDSWGVSWDGAWGLSWFHGDVSQSDTESKPSGGIPARSRLTLRDGRTKEEIRRDRERFGIIPEPIAQVIASVAARQAENLDLDEQKRYEELSREITLLGLEFEARYLEAVNIERQRLIDAEIGALLRRKLDEEEIMLMLVMAGIVA